MNKKKPCSRLIRMLPSDERGEANYISSFIYILVVVLLIYFIINVFSIVSTKQQMDSMVDELTKQIQLNGGVNAETNDIFNFLIDTIPGAYNLDYEVEAEDSIRKIQLGTTFYVTITGECGLGGFWLFDFFNITLVSRGVGVSEYYWKQQGVSH